MEDVSVDDMLHAYGFDNLPCKHLSKSQLKCTNNPLCMHSLFGLISKKNLGIWKKSVTENPQDMFPELVVPKNEMIERKDLSVPVGLKNLGATCYVNCLLQCLFRNIAFRKGIYQFEIQNESVSTVNLLQMIFGSLELSVAKFVDPRELVDHLNLEASIQQDVQEFNKLFLTHLERQLKLSVLPGVRNLIKGLFGGVMKYVTSCNNCGFTSERSSDFFELCVQVKEKAGLEESLNEFFGEELLEGTNQYFCSSCKIKRDSKRKLVIEDDGLPAILNIQLLRFVYDISTHSKLKVQSKFEIPRILEISKFNESSSKIYELKALFQHLGESAYSGHYVVDILDPSNENQWYRFDDESVSTSSFFGAESEISISSANAYMLVYFLKGFTDLKDEIKIPSFVKESVFSFNQKVKESGELYDQQKCMISSFIEERTSASKLFADSMSNFYSEFDSPFSHSSNLDDFVCLPKDWLKDWLCGLRSKHNKIDETNMETHHQTYEVCSVSKLKSMYPSAPNFDLISCMHGKIHPDNAYKVKVIPKAFCEILEISNFLVLQDLMCRFCCSDDLNLKHKRRDFSLSLSSIFERLKDPVHRGVWVSKSWILKLKKCVSSCKDFESLFLKANEENSAEHFEFNMEQLLKSILFDVICEHNNLSCNWKFRKLLSFDLLYQIIALVGKFLNFQVTTNLSDSFTSLLFWDDHVECKQCMESLEISLAVQEDKADLSSKFRALLSNQKSLHFPDFLSPPNPGLYNLIPFEWFSKWKGFLESTEAETSTPGAIDFTYLICQHKKLKFSPHPSDLSSDVVGTPQGIFVLLRQSDYLALEKKYSSIGGIDSISLFVEMKTNSSEPELLNWDSLRLTTNPQVCMECVQKRIEEESTSKLFYEEGAIDILIVDKAPSESAKMTARNTRKSKRSRKGNTRSCTLFPISSEDSIMMLRLKIYENLEVSPVAQRLFHGLEEIGIGDHGNDMKLQDLKIENGSTLYLLITEANSDDEYSMFLGHINKLESESNSQIQRVPEIGFQGSILCSRK